MSWTPRAYWLNWWVQFCVQLHIGQRGRWQALSWTKMEWPGEWSICGDDCFSFLADCITQYSTFFFFSFFHSSLVFPLDLCVMYLYVYCDRVNTSTVTTTAYDSDDKWMETHSGRLQDCLQCDIEASLLSRSQDTSLEGLPSRITPSDIFFSFFLPSLSCFSFI